MASVSLKGVKVFSTFVAIPNLDLNIKDEFIVFAGPSMRQDHTLRMLAGLETPTYVVSVSTMRMPPTPPAGAISPWCSRAMRHPYERAQYLVRPGGPQGEPLDLKIASRRSPISSAARSSLIAACRWAAVARCARPRVDPRATNLLLTSPFQTSMGSHACAEIADLQRRLGVTTVWCHA